MPKTVERYYVEPPENAETHFVIRDRISPLRDATYPADIVVEIWTEVIGSKIEALQWAKQICAMLNE